jgi:hypothetical protein
MTYSDKFLNGLLKAQEIVNQRGVEALTMFIESYSENVTSMENTRLEIEMQHRG